MATQIQSTTGRRKEAVARVRLRPGSGKIVVNNKDVKAYFGRETSIMVLVEPLKLLEQQDKIDIEVNVRGGGLSGQAGAIRLGVTRALMEYNPEFRPALKKAGFVTRDSRVVERKKYGRPGARKRFQFSKR